MVIQVELHTMLQIQTPEGTKCCISLTLPEGASVHDVLHHLDIQLDPEHLLLAVNRRVVEPEHVLADGDKVDIIPAMSGG